MDVNSGDWSRLSALITENYGVAYDPAKVSELRPKLVRLLTREIAHLDRDDVVNALDNVMRHVKVTLGWHRFLCILLSSLRGWWVKLTNNPGFGASTMLLLTDGTVMCQQEGGVTGRS
jgi:hypothetical protein